MTKKFDPKSAARLARAFNVLNPPAKERDNILDATYEGQPFEEMPEFVQAYILHAEEEDLDN